MDSNKDILNTISDSNRRFAKKKREEDLLGVPEKVAAELEKAMEQEDNGYFDKAKDICVQILATEEGRNVEKVVLTLARIYPKFLKPIFMTVIKDTRRMWRIILNSLTALQ